MHIIIFTKTILDEWPFLPFKAA